MKNVAKRIAVAAFAATLVMFIGTARAEESSDTKAKEVKAAVIGKVEVRSEKAAGKDVKVAYVKVMSASDAEGAAMGKMKDANLKVVGPKSADVAKFVGKEVSIAGKIRDGKEIHVDAVAMKSDEEASDTKAPAKPKKSAADEGSDKK